MGRVRAILAMMLAILPQSVGSRVHFVECPFTARIGTCVAAPEPAGSWSLSAAAAAPIRHRICPRDLFFANQAVSGVLVLPRHEPFSSSPCFLSSCLCDSIGRQHSALRSFSKRSLLSLQLLLRLLLALLRLLFALFLLTLLRLLVSLARFLLVLTRSLAHLVFDLSPKYIFGVVTALPPPLPPLQHTYVRSPQPALSCRVTKHPAAEFSRVADIAESAFQGAFLGESPRNPRLFWGPSVSVSTRTRAGLQTEVGQMISRVS